MTGAVPGRRTRKVTMTRSSKNKKIPVLSFFTGAGFLDLGFLRCGFETVWHNEYHKPFVRAFETGIASCGYNGRCAKVQNVDSIVDVGPNAIIREAFTGSSTPDVYGMIGGPPCPDFSVGGKNRGHKGDRGRLSEVYVNRILELNPTFFVFENVPGLLRTHKHRAFLHELITKLQTRYFVDIRILNALDLGVPQDRERVLLVGFRRSWVNASFAANSKKRIAAASQFVSMLDRMPLKEFFAAIEHWFPWPEDARFKGAKYRFPWPREPVPLGDVPEEPECPSELMAGTYLYDEKLARLPNGEGFRPKSAKFSTTLEGDVSRKSFKRLHRYRYSPAAAYGNNEVHLHPTEPRRLTVREAMRIQSVPDEYVLPTDMALSDKFKTIGNGVPVRLAEALAGAVAEFLKGGKNEAI